MLLGVAAVVGWAFRLQSLTSVVPGSVVMKMNTAIALVLCAAALLVLVQRTSAGWERLAQGCALAALAIGLASLAEYLFGWQLGIDELLFKDPGAPYTTFRGRMSPFSAAAFISIGFALAAIPYKTLGWATKMAAGFTAVIGLVSLLGYLWSVGELTTDQWLPPAISTAVCFVLLGGAVLLLPIRSERTLIHRVTVLAAVEVKIPRRLRAGDGPVAVWRRLYLPGQRRLHEFHPMGRPLAGGACDSGRCLRRPGGRRPRANADTCSPPTPHSGMNIYAWPASRKTTWPS